MISLRPLGFSTQLTMDMVFSENRICAKELNFRE